MHGIRDRRLDHALGASFDSARRESEGRESGAGVVTSQNSVGPLLAAAANRERFRQLADAVGALMNAASRAEVIEIVRRSARAICGASGIAIVLRDGELCHYICEDSETPLWSGQRFPMDACISGWSMRRGVQAVIADIYQDPRIPHEAYRPTGVESLVMTPVGRPDAYAALGAYWTRPHEPHADEIASLKAISECMAAALQAIDMRRDLEERLAESERRREALETARREVAFQAHLLDVVQQAVIATDREGRVTYWNAYAEQLYGWTKAEAIGRTVLELNAAPSSAAEAEAIMRDLQAGGSWTGEMELSRKDGQTFPAWVSDWPVRDQSGELVGVVGVSVDNTARRRAEDHQRLLINELNHRVKNTLAIVQSMASQSLRGAGVADARHTFEARLFALSDAHNLMVDAGWTALPLDEVVATVLKPFGDPGHTRFDLQGPPVRLAPRTAIAFSLAVHELATNAVKYGALSNSAGRVRLHWAVDTRDGEPQFRAEWRESGGPEVEATRNRRGFGTRLIEQGLAAELSGQVALDFARPGLICRIEAPAAAALARADADGLFPLPA